MGAGGDRQNVPGVHGNNMGDEGVNVVRRVGEFRLAVYGPDGLHVVSPGAERGGAFYLHTPEARSVVEDEVVALAVGPGFGDAESQAGGFEEEGGFGIVPCLGGIAFCGMVRGSGRSGASSWRWFGQKKS